MLLFVYSTILKGVNMRKIHRFKNTKPVFVIEKGVKYQVMDLGGHKMKVRVRSTEEIARDSKLFKESKRSK